MAARLERLLPISPGDHRVSRDLVAAAEGLRRAGVRQLLLREPQLTSKQLTALARALAGGLRLIVHARCDGGEALARSGGFGLHLTGGADVRAVRARFKGMLGYSAHSLADAIYARQAGADYALISPVWRPGSKPGDSRPTLGVRAAARVQRAAGLPCFALGGLTPERAGRCRTAGIFGAAAIGAFFAGEHPEDVEAAGRAFLVAQAAAAPAQVTLALQWEEPER